jgi:hypothetical protein
MASSTRTAGEAEVPMWATTARPRFSYFRASTSSKYMLHHAALSDQGSLLHLDRIMCSDDSARVEQVAVRAQCLALLDTFSKFSVLLQLASIRSCQNTPCCDEQQPWLAKHCLLLCCTPRSAACCAVSCCTAAMLFPGYTHDPPEQQRRRTTGMCIDVVTQAREKRLTHADSSNSKPAAGTARQLHA